MRYKTVVLFLFIGFLAFAQEQQLANEDLADFEGHDGNWKIVGDVTMDKNFDIRDLLKGMPTKSKKKKRKRKKGKDITRTQNPIVSKEGKGILLNSYDSVKKSTLTTKWEHGDIKLDMEVMIPKGSDYGIYFQGRYELKIKDSWKVKQPKYSDFGGIYKNSEKDEDKKFSGIPPLSNASKAPGLWQKLQVHFQAPKFSSDGRKIAQAKFVSVELNGVRIQNNVEVSHPTDRAISMEEVEKGPLMIQGNQGFIAFKNINYSLLNDSDVKLSSITYKIYKGIFNGVDEIDKYPIFLEGSGTEIDIHTINEENDYGIIYSGIFEIPKDDDYTFTMPFTGGIDFLIDGKSIIKHNSGQDEGRLIETIKLSAGDHPFSLINVKSAGWRTPRLGLFVHTVDTNPKVFHTYDSYPPIVNSGPPILVEVGSKPRLLRGFVDFDKGLERERLSHTIGVGSSSGINFIYDLATANLIGVWRGEFLNATPMWRSRGDGSFKPQGAVQWTFLNQPIAQLENSNVAFPKTGSLPDFVPKGYTMDKTNGLPVFKHTYKGVDIENRVVPNIEETHLIHEVNFSKSGLINWYYKLASGNIKQLSDGSYAIKKQGYYIKMLSKQVPIVREVDGETELVLIVDGSNIKYEIIW